MKKNRKKNKKKGEKGLNKNRVNYWWVTQRFTWDLKINYSVGSNRGPTLCEGHMQFALIKAELWIPDTGDEI